MTDAQLDILADVREAISRGIEEVQNTRRRSELYEKEGSPKRKETRRVQNEILWLPCIRWFIEGGWLLYIERKRKIADNLLFRYLYDDKRSMLKRAIFALNGLGRDESMTINRVEAPPVEESSTEVPYALRQIGWVCQPYLWLFYWQANIWEWRHSG